MFDAISVQLALLTDEQRTILLENKKIVKKTLYDELHKEELFFLSVTSSTGDKNRVHFRHKKVKMMIDNIIN